MTTIIGWTDEERAALEAAEQELAQATAALEAEREHERAAQESPAALIAERKAALEAKRAELARLEQNRLDAAALAKAEAKYGKGRAILIETPAEGIVLRPLSEREIDVSSARMAADGLSSIDREKIARSDLLATVAYPEKDKVRELISRWPGLWQRMIEAREALIDGRRQDVAKKG